MFFRKTLDRIESKLDNIEYSVTERKQEVCLHPCSSVFIRPGNFLWVKVCGKCNKQLDWYLTEWHYLNAKQELMAEIMKVDKARIEELKWFDSSGFGQAAPKR